MSRILMVGRNDQFPRVVDIVLGVAVDGGACTYRATLKRNEAICPICNGRGEIETWDGNPSHRNESERCDECSGSGIVEIDEEGFE